MTGRLNVHSSPMFGLFNTCQKFGVLNEVIGMINETTTIVPKSTWSKRIWGRAWALDDAYWRSTSLICSDNDLLFHTVGRSQYLTWWYISDKWPHHIRMCKILAKIVCRTSRFKCDDYRLKTASHSQRMCERCDLSTVETIGHLIMQCPSTNDLRLAMYDEIRQTDPLYDERRLRNPGESLYWLLGKHIPGVEHDQMVDIWKIAGMYIQRMYKDAIEKRESVE